MIRALVTGGSGAIGAAICRRLAAQGTRVAVHANRNLRQAEAVAESIHTAGGKAEALAFDVTDAAAATAALEKLLADGPVQIVVNNAGIHADAPMAGMSEEQWKSVLDVSLHGFFNVTKPLLLADDRHALGTHRQPVVGRRGARQSRADQLRRGQGRPARRDALARARACLARHHGQRGRARHHRLAHDQEHFHRQRDQLAGADEARGPAGRGGGAGGIPRSEEAGYISGQVISIDGAMT
jgi:3-oxoacyl-[acyl-carrier protein] reductase